MHCTEQHHARDQLQYTGIQSAEYRGRSGTSVQTMSLSCLDGSVCLVVSFLNTQRVEGGRRDRSTRDHNVLCLVSFPHLLGTSVYTYSHGGSTVTRCAPHTHEHVAFVPTNCDCRKWHCVRTHTFRRARGGSNSVSVDPILRLTLLRKTYHVPGMGYLNGLNVTRIRRAVLAGVLCTGKSTFHSTDHP